MWKVSSNAIHCSLALLGIFCLAIATMRQGTHIDLTVAHLASHATELDPVWLRVGFLLALVGFGTKMGLAPLHSWKPDAYGEAPPPGYSEWSGASSGGGEDYNLEAFVSAETTLADHLAEQMALAISNPAGRMIGQYLIDMVDEAGYLTGDLETVAEKLGARRSDVELVLAVLQTFDPAGVCARNLTECLGIQLKDRRLGLVDFPSEMNGRKILLCWRLGEAEVQFWHELDAGYAGRQPLSPSLVG